MLHSSNSGRRPARHPYKTKAVTPERTHATAAVSTMSSTANTEQQVRSSTIRKLWIGEAGMFCDHLLRLDPESRRSRFGSPVNRDFIENYAARAIGPDTVVHGCFGDGALRGVAELRPFGKVFPFEAEAAFSVERDWQSRGVGSALFDRTVLAARNRGIRTVYMSCLATNRRMQALARKYEAELRFEADDVTGALANPGPSPLSLWREVMTEGHGFAAAILDLQSRLLRPA
jgi:GNAT superfamily N-acetyltransferase